MIPFLLLAATLQAQSLSLPSTWVGAGLQYNAASSPKAGGWISYAPLASKTAQLYSFTTVDFMPLPGKLAPTQSSIRTGAAPVLRQLGNFTLLGLADVGFATANTSTTGAVSGGGFVVYRLRNDITIEIGARFLKAGSVNQVIWEIGSGKVFP